MAKMAATGDEEIPKVAKHGLPEDFASASTPTAFPYDQHSIVALRCPSMLHPFEPAIQQCRSQNDNPSPTMFPMIDTWRPNLFPYQGNPSTIPNPGALFYALPFPCFCPFHSPPNAPHPPPNAQPPHPSSTNAPVPLRNAPPPHSSSPIHRHSKTHLSNNPFSTVYSPHQSFFTSRIERDSLALTTLGSDDPHQASFGIPLERRHTKIVDMTTPLNCVRPSSSSVGRRLNVDLQQENFKEEAVVLVSAPTANTLPEENVERANINREAVNVDAAAEARRKRRDALKLKTTQGCK